MRRWVGCLVFVGLFSMPVPLQAQFFSGFEWLWQEPKVSSEGSMQVRYWVNLWISREGVRRLSDAERDSLVKKKKLIPLSAVANLDIARTLRSSRQYLHPWAAEALADLAAVYASDTARSLPLNSALRTIEEQTAMLPRRIRVRGKWRWVGNMNAIPAQGPFGSAHPFGNTVDLARFRIPDWYEPEFERKLLRLEAHGCLDVTKESGQAVFHVTFFKQCRVGTTLAAALEGTN